MGKEKEMVSNPDRIIPGREKGVIELIDSRGEKALAEVLVKGGNTCSRVSAVFSAEN